MALSLTRSQKSSLDGATFGRLSVNIQWQIERVPSDAGPVRITCQRVNPDSIMEFYCGGPGVENFTGSKRSAVRWLKIESDGTSRASPWQLAEPNSIHPAPKFAPSSPNQTASFPATYNMTTIRAFTHPGLPTLSPVHPESNLAQPANMTVAMCRVVVTLLPSSTVKNGYDSASGSIVVIAVFIKTKYQSMILRHETQITCRRRRVHENVGLVLLWEQDCYRFGPVCQETLLGYCVLCGADVKGQADRTPESARQVFI
ncbi:hypothetical protein BGY98DRAFT_1122150 [Russula aff. rugulosa BPL654]|nr:hypothetical protein BGY98DRAFT_1122150 [Russula aff. rugulosa BPL654]